MLKYPANKAFMRGAFSRLVTVQFIRRADYNAFPLSVQFYY